MVPSRSAPPSHIAPPLPPEEAVPAQGSSVAASDPARTITLGALAGLAILKTIMLAALFTETPPHPPLDLAPLFGAPLALSALTAALITARSRWFAAPAIPVLLVSLLSFGPQKLYPGEGDFFAQSAAVYPAITAGSVLILVFILSGRAAWQSFAREVAR